MKYCEGGYCEGSYEGRGPCARKAINDILEHIEHLEQYNQREVFYMPMEEELIGFDEERCEQRNGCEFYA